MAAAAGRRRKQRLREALPFPRRCAAGGRGGGGRPAPRPARELQPDVVILDLMLPGLDGLQVCRRLREDPATARLPIIMLTAKAEEVDRILGLELGADDYVVKPFSPRELMARVRAVLRRTRGP